MEKRENFEVPEEVAEWIGLKKSEYLSLLIGQIRPDDFSFEKYHLFDHLIPETIDRPDKIIENSKEDYPIRVYIKTYPGRENFHQVVLGMMLEDEKSKVFIPILVFVTKFDELIKEFGQGQVISGPLLN